MIVRSTLVAVLLSMPTLSLASDGAEHAARPSMSAEQVLQIMDERNLLYSQRFADQEKAVGAALAAAKEAVNKAEFAAEKRFDSVNEFRSTLKDQQATLIPRSEVEVRLKVVDDRFTALASRLNLIEGRKEGASDLWGYLVGGVGALLAIGSFALTAMSRRGREGH